MELDDKNIGMLPKDDVFMNDVEPNVQDGDLEPIDDNENPEDVQKMDEKEYQYEISLVDFDEDIPIEDGNAPETTFLLTKISEDMEDLDGESPMEDDMSDMSDMEELGKDEQPIGDLSFDDLNIDPMKDSESKTGTLLKDAEGFPEEEGVTELIDSPMAEEGLEELPDEEGLEPLENQGETEWNKDDLVDIINSQDFEIKLYIDDETEFSVEEALDYLKLYPDNKIYITVEDESKFDESIQNKKDAREELLDEIQDEDETITIDTDSMTAPNDGSSGEQKEEDVRESFAVIKMVGNKKAPDGVYVGSLKENKIYGNFDSIKLTPTTVKIQENVFKIEQHNIKESKGKDVINFDVLDVDKFKEFISEKSKVSIDL